MMKINPNIVQHEFIGLKASIVKSLNPKLLGISGRIIDETYNTFKILHKGKPKVIPKDTSILHFIMSDETILEIEGKLLLGRPEDRIKKRPRRLW